MPYRRPLPGLLLAAALTSAVALSGCGGGSSSSSTEADAPAPTTTAQPDPAQLNRQAAEKAVACLTSKGQKASIQDLAEVKTSAAVRSNVVQLDGVAVVIPPGSETTEIPGEEDYVVKTPELDIFVVQPTPGADELANLLSDYGDELSPTSNNTLPDGSAGAYEEPTGPATATYGPFNGISVFQHNAPTSRQGRALQDCKVLDPNETF